MVTSLGDFVRGAVLGRPAQRRLHTERTTVQTITAKLGVLRPLSERDYHMTR
jgi:hypothetical protein